MRGGHEQGAAPAARVVAAATDGACSGNPGPGGWGALLRFEDGRVREFGGAEAATTNNRMELQAALRLFAELRRLPRHPDLVLRTDSKYLIDGLQSWLPGWKRKGWRTAAGKPVLNRDLWEALEAARLPDVPLRYVKGHSGDPDNDRVDAIAVAFAQGRTPALQGQDGTPGAGGAGAAEEEPPPSPAPAALVELLSRLELADRLAEGGYTLSTAELAQLVEQPTAQLEDRRRPWRWRDWQVQPSGASGWRLTRHAPGSR